jgi:uncharacterized phage protein gp47/JayE
MVTKQKYTFSEGKSILIDTIQTLIYLVKSLIINNLAQKTAPKATHQDTTKRISKAAAVRLPPAPPPYFF